MLNRLSSSHQTILSKTFRGLSKSQRWNDPILFRSLPPSAGSFPSLSHERKSHHTRAIRPKVDVLPDFLVAKTLSENSVAQHFFGQPQEQSVVFPRTNVHVCSGLSSYQPSDRVVDAIRSQAAALGARHFTDLSSDSELPMIHPCAQRNNVTSDEAFHVLDLERVVEKYNHWASCFPGVTPFYAVKSNPNPAVVETLANLGCGFDCASPFEFELVSSMGVPPERIIYANPCKSPDAIAAAKRSGVYKTTFDSESELVKLSALYPQMELVLRIGVDDKDAQCPLSNKFGASLIESERLLKLAKVLGMKVTGVSFHVGSGGTMKTYASALTDAKSVFDLGLKLGHPMSILDIGGGFPGTCDEASANLTKISQIVTPFLSQFPEGTQFISEPGRYFCAESQTLAAMIIGKRIRDGRISYFIADGVYQSFNCIMYDHSEVMSSNPSPGFYPSNIFGQTCDGLDEIAKSIELPSLNIGDWIAFPTMGAYTLAAASRFNGFRVPHLVVLPTESC